MTSRKAASNKDMNGLQVQNLGVPANNTDAATKAYVDTASTADRSRANHTGTQLAATISDFNTAVRLNEITQLAAPTSALVMNSQKISTLADPTVAQDAATKNYVDTQLSGVATGLVLKGAVEVAASTNITLATPGASIDGITLTTGDQVLLTGQTTGSQNGPYTFNGAASALTRATNWNTSAEAVLGSFWIVKRGTNADKFAVLTNDTAIVLDTTALTFTFVGTAQVAFTSTSPAISAGQSWTVSHNLGTKAVLWQVYRTASPFDDIDVYGVRTDNNTLTITPDIAMAAAEYTCVVR